MEDRVRNYWKNIYEMNENKMNEVWYEEAINDYHRIGEESRKTERTNEILIISSAGQELYRMECCMGLREYLDMAAKVEQETEYMEYPEITEEQVKKNLKKIQKGRAAGPDGMKPEFYKALGESPIFIKFMKL